MLVICVSVWVVVACVLVAEDYIQPNGTDMCTRPGAICCECDSLGLGGRRLCFFWGGGAVCCPLVFGWEGQGGRFLGLRVAVLQASRTWRSASCASTAPFPLILPCRVCTYRTPLKTLPPPFPALFLPPQSSFAIKLDLDKCIKCSRCVTTCEEVQGMNVLGMFNRGRDRHIGFIYGELLL